MLIDVALPLPLFRTFTYQVNGTLEARVRPGSRVVVPFRNRRELGICLGPSDGAALGKAAPKAVLAAPDETPSVSGPMLELCRWAADYYVAPIGQVLRSALPVALTGAADPTPAQRTRRVATVARHLPSLLHRERIFARAPQQRALYELLESLGGRATVEHLLELLSFSPSVLRGLVARGLVTVSDEVVARDPFAGRVLTAPHAAHPPSPAQRAAIEAMGAARPGEVFLLHGITGSGKTLVYIELLRRVVQEQGRTAIVLVPEIALTPQTVDRFRSVFGDRVAVLHSALGDGERYDEWLALKRGEKRIAVGARSAVFAPLDDLGAIVVDEEHEASYKQGESPRYHARELAVVRARLEGATVVLGSATPSLESWANAEAGKYRLLTLPDRAGAGRLPSVEVIDLRAEKVAAAAGAATGGAPPQVAAYRAVVTPRLDASLAGCLDRGEQAILLLNRRGYSAFIQCGDCGDVATCPQCSITLTYHRTPERLVCHYCLHREEPRASCRRCGGATLRQRGLGTQQLERLLVERFPAARIARMDVDTTSGKWAHAEILDRVGRGEVDILLGTQMIAKGLDFPNVTLVGVIDADVGINLPDFRASERCFQLLGQVAGRAGRGPKGGRVLIQTRLPQHHAVRCAVTHDYLAFVREEVAGREQPPYPPLVRLANVVFSGLTEQDTERLAQRGAEWLRRLVARRAPGAVTVIGPAPCAVERIKTRWRWHALLKAEHPADLTRVARYFLERFDVPKVAQLRVTVDRDPVSLL
ncbi:MAG TPA: primosomal protein N' [Gemmatimonadaceae bacterium]|nr:primosomal protein N' [Gemmatimonadaceae bacterium]